jgi:hypothetical protein
MFDQDDNSGIFDGPTGVGDSPNDNVEQATTTEGEQPIPPAAPSGAGTVFATNQNVPSNQNVPNVATVTAQVPTWLAPFVGAGLLSAGLVALLWPAVVGAAGSALAAPRGKRSERILGGAIAGLAAGIAANMIDAQHRVPYFPTVASFGGGYIYGFKQTRGEWPTPTTIKEAHTAPALPAPR